ncbi:MAG: response regulator [Isosphaeraceae bacterium]
MKPAPSILLADDDAVIRTALKVMLRPHGYRVEAVRNGFEVLEACDRQQFDVVLMDVQMPEMGGVEAADRLRRRLPPGRLPRIIALSGDAGPEDRDVCRAAGMDDLIAKPLRACDVLRVLDGCVRAG